MKITAFGKDLQTVRYRGNIKRIGELTKAVEESYSKNAILIIIRIPENMKIREYRPRFIKKKEGKS